MLPATVTSYSCIACNSAAWVFGGVRLISSASTMLAKTGPRMKRKLRLPLAGSWSMISVPVMSLGIRSGVNWIRRELQVQGLGQRRDGQRLRQARHADRQAMSPREDADEHLLDHLVLADDDLVNLVDQRLAGLGNPADGFFRTHGGGGGRHAATPALSFHP